MVTALQPGVQVFPEPGPRPAPGARNQTPPFPVPARLTIRTTQPHASPLVVFFEEVLDRDTAEALRGTLLQIRREDGPALEPGEFWTEDLLGCPVFAAPDGKKLGEIAEVIPTGANDVYVVRVPAHVPPAPAQTAEPAAPEPSPPIAPEAGESAPKNPAGARTRQHPKQRRARRQPEFLEILIPAVDGVILERDVAGRRLVVDPDGLQYPEEAAGRPEESTAGEARAEEAIAEDSAGTLTEPRETGTKSPKPSPDGTGPEQ